jgi:hypothetical protein
LRNAYKILIGEPEEKKLFRRHRHGWEDNIQMDPRDIRLKGEIWIYLTKDRDWCQAVVSIVVSLHIL